MNADAADYLAPLVGLPYLFRRKLLHLLRSARFRNRTRLPPTHHDAIILTIENQRGPGSGSLRLVVNVGRIPRCPGKDVFPVISGVDQLLAGAFASGLGNNDTAHGYDVIKLALRRLRLR